MDIDLTHVLIFAAVAANGLLSGASLDQSIKQLPARRRIGSVAYSDYSRAGDLGNGIAFYATLGVGAAVLSAVVAILVLTQNPTGPQTAAAVTLLAASVVHMAITARAAPTNISQRRHVGDEAALTRLFDRFERLQTARVLFNLAALGGAIWLLVTAWRAAS